MTGYPQSRLGGAQKTIGFFSATVSSFHCLPGSGHDSIFFFAPCQTRVPEYSQILGNSCRSHVLLPDQIIFISVPPGRPGTKPLSN